MPSLSELWDENKYSEGDPIRQLIAASKAYKDWPADTLAWGADLVDLGSSGLAKILQRRPELAKAIKTDLGGNLRRALSEPRSQTEMTEYPAQDVQDGRSLGRMLNPALLFAGNQKISMPANRFSEAKRQFILGRNKAFEDEATAAIMKPTADVLKPIDEIAQTPVDRRSFLKGTAAVGAAAAGGGLLAKFGKVGEAAPEVAKAARVAEEIPKGWASTEGGAHRYHSLQDYADDMRGWADDEGYIAMMESGDGTPSEYFSDKLFRDRLKRDEDLYKQAKLDEKRGMMPSPYEVRYNKNGEAVVTDWADVFSPQAKKEMKDYKNYVGQFNLTHSSTGKPLAPTDWHDPDIMSMYLQDMKLHGEPQW